MAIYIKLWNWGRWILHLAPGGRGKDNENTSARPILFATQRPQITKTLKFFAQISVRLRNLFWKQESTLRFSFFICDCLWLRWSMVGTCATLRGRFGSRKQRWPSCCEAAATATWLGSPTEMGRDRDREIETDLSHKRRRLQFHYHFNHAVCIQ